MGYTTEFTDDYMGIVHQGSGAVTGSDIITACRNTTQLLENTENFHFEFIDFTEVENLQISPSELEQIVAQDRYAAILRPDAVVVIVAPRDELFEVSERWQERVQHLGWDTHIARSRPEATAWLRAHYPTPQVGAAEAEGDEKSATPAEKPPR